MKDFLENLLRYAKLLIGLILGIFFSLFERFIPYMKNPVTATAVVGLLIGVLAFTFFTLRAMLGLATV